MQYCSIMLICCGPDDWDNSVFQILHINNWTAASSLHSCYDIILCMHGNQVCSTEHAYNYCTMLRFVISTWMLIMMLNTLSCTKVEPELQYKCCQGIFMLSLFEENYSSLEQSDLVLDNLPRLLNQSLLCLRQRSGLLLASQGGGQVTGGHTNSCSLHLSRVYLRL